MTHISSIHEQSHVVIRFAGDSGDGMQLVGSELTRAAALSGNDISTLPEFPAEIRAPTGTLAGVSGFQLHFSSEEILTPGDAPDVLVAMNPAALKSNLGDLKKGGTLIVDRAQFQALNLSKAGYAQNPLEDGSLEGYRLIPIDMTMLVNKALEGEPLSVREKERCKNFLALGLMYWLYNKDTAPQLAFIAKKFAAKENFAKANTVAFKTGHAFGETMELEKSQTHVPKAQLAPGKYRSITGNSALAIGLVVGAKEHGLPLFLGSYPITPASDILHELARYKHFDVTTFQAEDEIAAACAAIGASYGGAIGVCTTSGPGFSLKSESIGLAVMLELPLVIIDVQRAGPSTGMPTKPEQADLLQAMYGRNGESPLPVIAPKNPADCFEAAREAMRVAIKYMTPVVLLSDAFIANSAEPWRLPEDLLAQQDAFVASKLFREDPQGYQVYARSENTLARDWVVPGKSGLEHRIGGLEKHHLTGEISYDALNHEKMVMLRAQKVQKIVQDFSKADLEGDESGEILLIGWGGSHGALRQATRKLRAQGVPLSHLQLRWLHPFEPELASLLPRFQKVLIAEMNSGQLWRLLRSEYLVPAHRYNKIQGKPFHVGEIIEAVEALRGQA